MIWYLFSILSQLQQSNGTHVVVRNIRLNEFTNFYCEVTTDEPHFNTRTAQTQLQVYGKYTRIIWINLILSLTFTARDFNLNLNTMKYFQSEYISTSRNSLELFK